jgi:hypothetical protein
MSDSSLPRLSLVGPYNMGAIEANYTANGCAGQGMIRSIGVIGCVEISARHLPESVWRVDTLWPVKSRHE